MNLASLLCQDGKALILLRVQPEFHHSTASRLRCCSIFLSNAYSNISPWINGIQNPISYLILYIHT